MSQYSKSLGSSEKARYLAKLQAVGLTLEVDPYSMQGERAKFRDGYDHLASAGVKS